MNQGRFQLAHNIKKEACPACGQKRFRRFMDTETGELLPEHIGMCDREENCGYRKTAVDWLRDGGTFDEKVEAKPLPPPRPRESGFRIPEERVRATLYQEGNTLLHWLSGHHVRAADVFREYGVGTFGVSPAYPHLMGAPIFWNRDKAGEVHTGKVIAYLPDGHRNKNVGQTWVHHMITGKSAKDIGCTQVLFGEHLLNKYPGATVGVVESEKTALICRCFYPDVLWLSCGGMNNLSVERCMPLAGRHVMLFPDIGKAYREWVIAGANIEPMCASLLVSDVLECQSDGNDLGLDIGDFLIPPLLAAMGIELFATSTRPVEQPLPPVAPPPVAEQSMSPVEAMIKKFGLQKLVREFDLDLDKAVIRPFTPAAKPQPHQA